MVALEPTATHPGVRGDAQLTRGGSGTMRVLWLEFALSSAADYTNMSGSGDVPGGQPG
jgi:hypothetical protein